MSALTEALEFIEDWVKRNIPAHPAVMQPGLSRKEIDNTVKDLPFELPEEIYDLYQWHNGGSSPFIPNPEAWDLTSFPALAESVRNAKDFGLAAPIFPLFNTEWALYFILGSNRSEAAPVYCGDDPDEAIQQEALYPSLTTMMQTLADELNSKNS